MTGYIENLMQNDIISTVDTLTGHISSSITGNYLEVKQFLIDHNLHKMSNQELTYLVNGTCIPSGLNFYLNAKFGYVYQEALYNHKFLPMEHLLSKNIIDLKTTLLQTNPIRNHMKDYIHNQNLRPSQGLWTDYHNFKVICTTCRNDISRAKLILDAKAEIVMLVQSVPDYLNLTLNDLINKMNQLPHPASEKLEAFKNWEANRLSVKNEPGYIKKSNLDNMENLLINTRYLEFVWFEGFGLDNPEEVKDIFKKYPFNKKDYFKFRSGETVQTSTIINNNKYKFMAAFAFIKS